jgi:prolipoprotein diacylglyceryltransferase
MLAAHAAGTTMLFARPRPWLRRVTGVLGAAYILGILWERVSRESLRHPDTETTPLIAAGLALSAAMARVGLAGLTQRR